MIPPQNVATPAIGRLAATLDPVAPHDNQAAARATAQRAAAPVAALRGHLADDDPVEPEALAHAILIEAEALVVDPIALGAKAPHPVIEAITDVPRALVQSALGRADLLLRVP